MSDALVHASSAVYSPHVLRFYDWWVLGFSNRWLWRCPTQRLLAHMNAYVSDNHLDVGVGTGYFLDRCRFPTAQPRLALLDLNPHCLQHAAKRVARYQPTTHQASILEPIACDAAPFASISLNYVLHCLPGTLAEKGVVLDHLLPLLAPGGALFGSTLLGRDVPLNWPARRLMARYNRQGIFSNTTDDLASLHVELSRCFSDVRIETVGCVALFDGRRR